MERYAFFSDTTDNFVTPMEPTAYDLVTIRFRTARDAVDRVVMISTMGTFPMEVVEQDLLFDYYGVEIQMDNEIVKYYFEAYDDDKTIRYDTRGILKQEVEERYWFRIIPGFRTPDWAKGAVMYQIFVDRFYNGDSSNDVEDREYYYIGDYSVHVDDWYKYPAQMGIREFYGGDLQGVLDKMDYLEDLGVEAIYFNPLFVSPSNHKYDIQDYDNIDPHFGKIVEESGKVLDEGEHDNRHAAKYINRVTNPANLKASNELFAKVVAEAHKRGIKVILDGVFNHCGSFNKWMDRERIYEQAQGYEKGAYPDDKSPYRKYFRFHDENQWPYNATYEGWWNHDTLPKLNYEGSRNLYEYILSIGQKWVSAPYYADGWRLDVAADLGHSPEANHKFWEDFRKAVRQANPDALILAEHYGSAESWLRGKEWDTVMNYDSFMEPLTWFLTGMQKHSDDFRGDMLNNASAFWCAMIFFGAEFSMPSLMTMMNELSNHDHSRFLTRTNRKVGRANTLGPEAADQGVDYSVMREAVLIQMTWYGAPTIYYGEEAGLCGFTDPDNRRTYPWGRENHELIAFYKAMIALRKSCREFKRGSFLMLGEDYGYIAYGRFMRNMQSAVLVNNTEHEMEKEADMSLLGTPLNAVVERKIMTAADGYTQETETYTLREGRLAVKLPPHSAAVFRYCI